MDHSISHCYLDEIVNVQKSGISKGIPSICSANTLVIEATFHFALKKDVPVLIESTCNQINQFGGYVGKTPVEYVQHIRQIAKKYTFPQERILLGGDHLGPYVWRDEFAKSAMDKARQLVHDYVAAGYLKIHLDASMKLGDDSPDRPLEPALSAERAAEMAVVAEETYKQRNTSQPAPRYVIGTEVPVPGGIKAEEEGIAVTTPEHAQETVALHKEAFYKHGLQNAWERVLAVVVQPGVEFGDENLFEYQSDKAAELSRFIEAYPQLVYEAHSTDYQSRNALRQMVQDHFAILKVGPALTFALREGIFALAMIETQLPNLPSVAHPSNMLDMIESTMLEHPVYWQNYYHGDQATLRFARRYSFSDRIRYYWNYPQVQASLEQLLINLSTIEIPLNLLSQFLPEQLLYMLMIWNI